MKKVIHNYIYNLGYQILTLVLPFITIPYLSRVLGPTNLGIESYTISLVNLYIAFANAGTATYGTRQVAFLKKDDNKVAIEVYNIVLLRFILSCISLFLFLYTVPNAKYQNLLLLQVIFLIASTFLDCTWYFIGKEQFKKLVARNVFIKIVGFVLTILLVKDEYDLIIFI
ncbi:oligosaccharide flippase family protein, partial [Neobacillus niacini]|uniref:oligosaccharide flippase family protein n=1 Tax=Neobacillus niacini TaxID=86668 RepID=UPI002FFE3CF0